MPKIVAYFGVSLVSAIILLVLGIIAFVKRKSVKSLVSSLLLVVLFITHTIMVGFYHQLYYSYLPGIVAGLLCAFVGYLRLIKCTSNRIPFIILSIGLINLSYYSGVLHALYYHYNAK